MNMTKEELNGIYNQGYKAGHHDTVEGIYTDIFDCDMNKHHDDVVAGILSETTEGSANVTPK